MATFMITAPDGKKYRVTGDTPEGAMAALQKMQGAATAPEEPGFWSRAGETAGDMLKAGAAGVSRGVTGLMDLPGMVMGGAGNLAASGLEATGAISPGVAQGMRDSFDMMPAGSGDKFRGAASKVSGGASEFRGDTTAGQYAGTVGEFLPGAVMGPGGPMRNLLTYGVIPGLASEGAGQLTEGTAWEPWARVVAPIAAGAAASRLTQQPGPKAPTREGLAQQADDLYRTGDVRPAAMPQDVTGLRTQIDSELQALNVKTPTGRVVADGNVRKFLDVLEDFDGQQMKPEQMQTMRRILKDAAGSSDPADRRIGTILLDKFDDWRSQHVPEYTQADALYGRMKRADDVGFRIEKAERRAASSGTGGNAVNTTRQNIRAILDNPKAKRGYSKAELDAMQQIVEGTPLVNALRLGGRLSPTSGALPLMGNLAGVGLAPNVAIPVMGAAAAAKGTAEALTNRQVRRLMDMILNGAPLPPNTAQQADRAATGLLGLRATNAADDRRKKQR